MSTRKACVIWAKEVKLNEFLARTLGAEIVVSYRRTYRGFRLPFFIRYFIQAIDTYQRLRKIRPQIILVMNPPIIAPLVVYLYCRINGAQFIIDTHTAGFLDRKWRLFHFLHRFLAKKALLNTVHNYKNLEILEKWQIKNGYVLQFYNPSREEVILDDTIELPEKIKEKIVKHNGLKVFMVNRFANDDAWKEVIETAKLMRNSLFFITGDYTKIQSVGPYPHNVIFTGYLSHEIFMKLMDRCDVVLALTKRRDTVLWSIREIMALGKPFVTTDSEVLHHYFQEVALFSDMAPEDLKEKILLAWNNRFELKGGVTKFLEQDRSRWGKDICYLENVINSPINSDGK